MRVGRKTDMRRAIINIIMEFRESMGITITAALQASHTRGIYIRTCGSGLLHRDIET
jgi:hypothetical protein